MPDAPRERATIDSVLHEGRTFPPPEDFDARIGGAYVQSLDEYRRLHARSLEDPEGFWAEAAETVPWMRRWSRVLEGDLPDARWFVGGTLNPCAAAVDQHVESGHGDEVALVWEGEPVGMAGPEIRRLTYRELQQETSRLANVLEGMGVRRGDVVTIYMGMVPELAITVLACARIGAPHSVIFGGFSSQAILDRVQDAGSRVVVTCDGAWRRGHVVPLKANVDEAVRAGAPIERVLVVKRCGNDVGWDAARDAWWHEALPSASAVRPCEPLDSDDLLFLLYTSGSTGKPKGIRHAVGGYLVHAVLTAKLVFNLRPDAGHLHWCTADVGWVTGHSYVLYGILPLRVPTLMYEGAPNFPAEDRFWDVIERHRVTHFYTAPTAIRAFMRWGDQHVERHDLTSLRVLGSVGEPINPEAWTWYRTKIGGDRCPVVDTWWQTETGGHMITPLPGATPTTPGSCTLPFFGVDAAIVDENGREQAPNKGGLLVVRRPWPGMLRGIHGDRERFLSTYFSRIPGAYLTGDGARRDERGYFWVMGRVDDVINVAGHRLGTMEIESALASHPAVAEAAVVGIPHEIKGTGIAAFVTLRSGRAVTDELRAELAAHVTREIGAIARPDVVRFTQALPKTRSGKIMRRLLRDVASGTDTGQDTTTLEDLSVIARLRESEES